MAKEKNIPSEVPPGSVQTIDTPAPVAQSPAVQSPPESPELAATMRQANHEPEPITDAPVYAVQAYGVQGVPVENSLSAPMTHEAAIAECARLNAAPFGTYDAGTWFGVVHVPIDGAGS